MSVGSVLRVHGDDSKASSVIVSQGSVLADGNGHSAITCEHVARSRCQRSGVKIMRRHSDVNSEQPIHIRWHSDVITGDCDNWADNFDTKLFMDSNVSTNFILLCLLCYLLFISSFISMWCAFKFPRSMLFCVTVKQCTHSHTSSLIHPVLRLTRVPLDRCPTPPSLLCCRL